MGTIVVDRARRDEGRARGMVDEFRSTARFGRPPDTLVMLGSEGPGVEAPARLAVLSELQMRLFGRAKVTLGRYEVVETIGRGAFGVVFRAHDPELQRDVAAKVLIRTSSTSGPLMTEARAVARLNHPNVVAVHDVGRCDASVLGDDSVGEGVFIVMELVDGPSLAQWLEAERAPAEILRAFRQAGEGLAAAHAVGLIHRDFKPANVLVNGRGVAKVADFGLATELTVDEDMPLDGEDRYLAGTPPYIAPEILDGAAASEHSDQYAYCVSLRAALCGTPVFDAKTMGELWVQKQALPAWGPSDRISRPLRRVIERGMAVDPAQRWPDMPTLLAALDAIAPGRRSRAFRATVATAAMAAMVVVVSMVVLVVVGGRSGDDVESDEPALASAEAVGPRGAGSVAEPDGERSSPASAEAGALANVAPESSGGASRGGGGDEGDEGDGADHAEPTASAAGTSTGSSESGAARSPARTDPSTTRSRARRRSGPASSRRAPSPHPSPAADQRPERLSTAIVQRAASRAAADCGQQGGMARVSVGVQFEISPQGSVSAVRVREPYTHGPIGRCVVRALEGLSLPAAREGRRYQGSVTLGGSAQ